MNEALQLYFIAIMLPHKVDEEIAELKREMAHRFNSKKALRTASHITLKAPFKSPVAPHQEILRWFEQISITVTPFVQEIKDFGAFSNRRNPVIYINPLVNASLQQLQKEVLQQFATAFPEQAIAQHEQVFSPHITIAYRDLLPHQFKAAWNDFSTRQYAASFAVNSFQLLQHINGKWNVIGSCLLK